MAVTVRFYQFSKRRNSTARPSGGMSFSCLLKDSSGILNPSIEIAESNIGNPASYNYAYISDYSRYYWVNEWSYYRGVWLASLNVDVMATWKNYIGSSSQYILRSSNFANGDIIDNMYPAKVSTDYSETALTAPFVDSVSDGCFAIRVINKYGSIGPKTYLMTKTELATFMQFMFQTISWADIDPDEISESLQKGLINPFQYIVDCKWLPLPISSVWGSLTDVYFGYWQVTGLQAKSLPATSIASGNVYHSIPKHPDYLLRGNYLNVEPYTRLSVYFPPFGLIPIDTTKLYNKTNINLDWTVDMTTGDGILEVKADSVLLSIHECIIGVPIQISQLSQDIISATTNAIGGIAGTISNAMTGNVAGAISSAVSGVGNAVNSMLPQLATNGSTGSFAQFIGTTLKIPKILSQFNRPVDSDNADLGRPLCSIRTISSTGGYIMVREADISLPATDTEISEVKSLMEGGFFYE